jgi:hypothetical protein
VTVDSERVGVAPLAEAISVEAGAHTVRFKGPDGATETDSVTVLTGEKAVARFNRTAAAPPPAPLPPPPLPPAPVPPPEATPPPASKPTPPGPVPEATPPNEGMTPSKEHTGPGPLAPPKHIAPVILLGTLAVAGFTTAVVAGVVFKGQAQDNANTTAASLDSAASTAMLNHAACNPPANSRFAQACKDFTNDNNDVNVDATVGNIGIAVGAAAAVGGVLYWILADKATDEASSSQGAVVTPVVGRSFGGFSLSGHF